jgi:hypothetical protein
METVKANKTRPPSYRLKKAAAFMVANNSTKADALRAAGYSEAIARSPSKLIGTEANPKPAWAKLLAEIDDAPLLERVRGIAMMGQDRDSLSAVALLQRWKGHDASVLKVQTLTDEIADLQATTVEAPPNLPLLEGGNSV